MYGTTLRKLICAGVGFLCAPAYSFFLSLRNQQPLFAKELVGDTYVTSPNGI